MKGYGDPKLDQHAKNRQRQNDLIAYAKPYRLNIETTPSALLGGGSYKLTLEHPKTGSFTKREIERNKVDRASDPPAVIKGYINEMKYDLEKNYPPPPDLISEQLYQELTIYCRPFELTLKSSYDVQRMRTTVDFSVRSGSYGFKAAVLQIDDASSNLAENQMKYQIDKMRTELGYESEEKEEEVEEVAQVIKPFVLGCPDHGGQMVKLTDELNHDGYFVCLVPDCTKKARQKDRVQPASADTLAG